MPRYDPEADEYRREKVRRRMEGRRTCLGRVLWLVGGTVLGLTCVAAPLFLPVACPAKTTATVKATGR